jgi:hypothetical protein
MMHAYGIQLSAGLFAYGGAPDSSMLPWPQLACDALHVYHPAKNQANNLYSTAAAYDATNYIARY